VKIKNKELVQKEIKREQPMIVPNVKSQEEPTPPTEEASKLLAQLSVYKQNLVGTMKEFNRLLSIRTLAENKSINEKDNEQSIVNKLAQAALSVEQLSPKEGLLALCILAIRQSLSLRDAGNEMAYKISQLEEKIKTLESNPVNAEPIKDVKKQMMEISDVLKKLAQGGKNE
jgi:hypothetical protein